VSATAQPQQFVSQLTRIAAADARKAIKVVGVVRHIGLNEQLAGATAQRAIVQGAGLDLVCALKAAAPIAPWRPTFQGRRAR
jgi:hypothetical protein